MSGSFDAVPLWGLFPIAGGLLWLAMEGGYRAGTWRRTQAAPSEKDQPVGAMVAAILGLLALLLGFTFSLAASRFEARRRAVLDEANAIGTTYLRARLLPEPERTEVGRLLREYVDVRVRGVDEGRIAEAIARSEALHESLWTAATAAAATSSTPIMTSLFVQSLNALIDLHTTRVMVGIRSRIPGAIWMTLLVLSAIGVAAVGYQSGLSATPRSPVMAGLLLAFALVLLVIADLDRAREGFFRESQQSLRDVQRTMRPGSPS